MTRLDALTVRESNDKSYFTKIGAAFPNKDGKGWTVLLDAMPASNDGQFKIMLREPLPKDDRERSARNDASKSGGTGWGAGKPGDDLDEIPFATNDSIF